MKKYFASLAFWSLFAAVAVSLIFLGQPASAQIDIGYQYANNIGLGVTDPKNIIVGIIQVILGFLGLLAVIIILYGGFKWMLSRGDESEVTSARKIIVAGVIGLLIVLASWGIANWVIDIIALQTGSEVIR